MGRAGESWRSQGTASWRAGAGFREVEGLGAGGGRARRATPKARCLGRAGSGPRPTVRAGGWQDSDRITAEGHTAPGGLWNPRSETAVSKSFARAKGPRSKRPARRVRLPPRHLSTTATHLTPAARSGTAPPGWAGEGAGAGTQKGPASAASGLDSGDILSL